MKYSTLILLVIAICMGCTTQTPTNDQAQDVELVTTVGTITIRLYDETPQHRDNFIKLVKDQFYDSILFHRVIENFMIQTGDPDSRTAASSDTLGRSDLPYTIPAEFHPDVFHKKGALGAARDNNPERASSSTQFYIVQGRAFTDSLLDVQLGRVNDWLSMNRVINDSANKSLVDRRSLLREENPDSDSIRIISDQLSELAKIDLENSPKYQYPEDHREAYKTLGGAPHLDQNYTVFGEVVKGLEIVDKIAATATNDLDRPIDDVRIINVRLVERKF